MNQNFIFVIILLTTLFTVNIRATTFNQCSEVTTPPLNVTIAPDPLEAGNFASFSVSGTLNNNITPATQLVIMFTDTNQYPLVPLYIQNFQDMTGQQVNVNVQVPTPAIFPSDYSISVVIGNQINLQDKPLDIYGCSYAIIGQIPDTNSFSLGVEASYPVAGPNASY